jgi:potassium efflux system protein
LGRNLPALMEITVLNRLPLDRGGRHAVSIIMHYSVVLTGVFVALRTLNINWASVQWLAAGITVGLGFGLQEIFANFVSGMILLFERPIRVGDIITLDDVTGTVTNIRIRATTVTNWDRKELIVPNKDLVTGRLLNWTLSDTTNRIVINVGVAYQSDANRARQIMQQTVVSHPNVLTDPPPAVTFESFGDSTLNFVIRAYLASLDVRLETIHGLHVSLHQRLQKEGIEIAFPQRDINIRNVNWPAQAMPAERSSVSRRSEAA